jgi:hypothetical protein
MREKSTFEDEEFKEYANRLVSKYPRFFPEDFDLEKFFFIRTEEIKPKWISKVRKIGHPWGALPGLDRVIYLVETAEENWSPLSDSQRVLVVFHELKHIPEGGCDYDSNECGKVIEHPVQDFPECIAAANGNLFWMEPGHGEDLPNILDSHTPFDLEAALKRTGFIEHSDRKPLAVPEEEIDEDEDLAKKMIESLEERKKDSELGKIKRTATIEESDGKSEEVEESKEDIVVDEV